MEFSRRFFVGVLTLLFGAVFQLFPHFATTLAATAEVAAPRITDSPASDRPDQVCLTWSSDPRTTQTIQWRTACSTVDGWVQYREKDKESAAVSEVEAKSFVIEDRNLQNDPKNQRFSAILQGLRPSTAYVYRTGSKQKDLWSDWAGFSTAPDGVGAFSFVYMGDPQVGFEHWGKLLRSSIEHGPKTAFFAIAGDIVNAGNQRNLWDEYFKAAGGVFDRYPFVPTLGNHDYSREDDPRLYRELLTLPENGPQGLTAEHNYSFRYGNALFVVLDSNRPSQEQAAWLDNLLAAKDALWKIALYHHPMYSSKGNRDNEEVRNLWGPSFDKYHLDLAMQGHDHAYLRTYPMRGGTRVSTPAEGTIYLVSVSGTKHYKQDAHDYTQVGFTNTSVYQLIDIATNPNRLTCRTYDLQGTVKDEFTIEK